MNNANNTMELYPLDLFPFVSKLLSAKFQQLAYIVSVVYLTAVAKLKSKSVTIEPVTVEKLQELVSLSHYKFDFVGDLQSCALLSINTLVALSAANKSWLKITNLHSDFQIKEKHSESSGKFLWKISVPPVKTAEVDCKSYLIQCLCVSNAPKDFVLYVSDVKFYNILNFWTENELVCGLTDKVKVKCDVENNAPLVANSAVVSGIFTDDISAKDFDAVLEEYFITPRLLKVGEVFCVSLSECRDQFRTKLSLYRLSDVYFKVVNLKGQSNKQEYYVIKGYTALYLNPPMHSYLPPKKMLFIKTINEIPGFEISRCPDGLIKYYNKLKEVFKLLIKRKNADGMILLTGLRGSGKKTTVKAVSAAFGLNLIQFNCFDLYGIQPSLAHGKLSQISTKARICAPCTLYLENVEVWEIPQWLLVHWKRNKAKLVDLLGREQNYNESTRLIDVFESHMRDLQQRKSTSYPLLVVGATQLKSSDVVPAIARLFIHTIPFEIPTPDETYLTMKWLLKRSNMICASSDLQKVAEKARGYVFADLVLLVQHAIRLRNEGSPSDAETQRSLSLDHFNQGLDVMETAYSDSIGAARVPKVHWEDIGGLTELKEEIMLTLNLPIQHPELFASGLKRSGILFYGPPGTGKTLMAKAVATECGFNFLSVKGPELMNMYVGQSEKNVREVFERARGASPCVIFFDELDSLAPSRGKSGDSGGVADRVVSQLLAEMDGLDRNKDVFVIAATNRPDLIDSALLRPGRFDKMFYVGVCKDKESALSVLKALTRRFNLRNDVDLEKVTTSLSTQVTGADLYSICSNAWFAAARRAVNSIESGLEVSLPLEVSSEDFFEAVAQFVPSLTAQDIDYYENLKSS